MRSLCLSCSLSCPQSLAQFQPFNFSFSCIKPFPYAEILCRSMAYALIHSLHRQNRCDSCWTGTAGPHIVAPELRTVVLVKLNTSHGLVIRVSECPIGSISWAVKCQKKKKKEISTWDWQHFILLNKDMRKINSYSLSQTGLQEQLPKTHSQSLFFTHTMCPVRLAGLWSLGEPGWQRLHLDTFPQSLRLESRIAWLSQILLGSDSFFWLNVSLVKTSHLPGPNWKGDWED